MAETPASDPTPNEVFFPPMPRVGAFLGQGLVIVISVLFALAVDRIVMGFDESSMERTYLEGLLEDFESIEELTAGMKTGSAERDSVSAIVLAALRGQEPADSSGMELAHALVLTGFVLDLQFARATWDDMVGTGRLYVVQNPELRKEIAKYYSDVDQLQIWVREWVEVAARYGDAVKTLLDPELSFAIGNHLVLGAALPDGPAPDARDLTRRIAATPELRLTISDVLLINKTSEQWYGELEWRARRIQQMIRSELGEAEQPAS
jgi:hypothetical protein